MSAYFRWATYNYSNTDLHKFYPNSVLLQQILPLMLGYYYYIITTIVVIVALVAVLLRGFHSQGNIIFQDIITNLQNKIYKI